MEAYLYEPLEDAKVKCNLCNHRCVIPEGNRGICNVRENQGGTLNTLVYGKLIAPPTTVPTALFRNRRLLVTLSFIIKSLQIYFISLVFTKLFIHFPEQQTARGTGASKTR